MVLKSYFDGANKANTNSFDRVVLATALGTSEQWDAFNEDWDKTLVDEHGVPFLHTTDAATLNKPFSLKDGWTSSSVDNVILDCVRVIKRHIAMPSLVPSEFRPDCALLP